MRLSNFALAAVLGLVLAPAAHAEVVGQAAVVDPVAVVGQADEAMASTDVAQEASDPEAAPEPMELGPVGYDQQGRAGRIHVVRKGDTLWDVSDAYLGTPWVWPSIWQDNRNIENPHLIFPGDRIWITPWEMRKVTESEAEALLGGSPAAPDEVPVVTTEEPQAPIVVPQIGVVREEQATYFVANREAVGFVSAETVEAAASIVSAVVKERMMLSQDDRVWIGLGEDVVENGDEFTIFRVQEKVFDPETGRKLGYHVSLLGWLEVTDVHVETASAVIRESTLDIEVEDLIMPRKPPVKEIAVQASPGEVSGQISFLAHQRTLVGTMEYVYLNRGTLDGLEVGSPLQVYRARFMADERSRGERVEVPDRVIADLLVVKAEPEVSVALVQHTEEVLSLGDRFRGADD